jgi:PAS domain S-box-containing protein
MNHSQARILAIDDTPANLLTLGAALTDEFDVQFATSGAQGLALAAENPPNLILLDIMMPEMDGFEVCRRLKATPELARIPVIFITALDDAASETQGLELGAADYITKPINPQTARHRIRNLLEREQLSRQIEHQRDQLVSQVDMLRKLTTAVEQSPTSVVITDRDGVIQYVNPRFTEVTGFSQAEAIGQNPRILQSGTTGIDVYQDLWRNLTGGQIWKGELCNKRKNGELYWEEAQIAPVRTPSGEISHFVAVKTDITERKKIEAELISHRHHLEALVQARTADLSLAKEAAEAANRAKSTFLANMSHELRTPLNGIMGLTGIALRRATDPKMQDQLGKVEKAAQNLLAIINDILDISKIESERLTLEQIDFRLGEILENIRSLIGPKAAEKGVTLHFESDTKLNNLALKGDPLRLGQVLINLIGNAVKFSAEGRVSLGVHLTEGIAGSVRLNFAVRDNGIGISPEDQQRIFDSFEQADGSFTRKHGGTGLGLAISKRLVTMMGGSISVESELGRGSIFRFSVNLQYTEHATQASIEHHTGGSEELLKARYAGRRVLLAEDEPINQEVSICLLEDVGLVVDLAEDGVQAEAMARRHDYALILMDMQMPRMGGLDATRAIRQIPERQSVPIIAITANAFEEDRHQCLEAGMNDFVTKPIDPDVLFRRLLKWLSPNHGD